MSRTKKTGKNSARKTSAPENKKKKKRGIEEKPPGKTLRRKAEEYLQQHPGKLEKMSRLEVEELIHELGTYQIELEMQNEELREAHQKLAQSRLRLSDLYDFSPVGYFTFDPSGIITSVNLTGASMLGMAKSQLARVPFSSFIQSEDAVRFHLYLHNTCREKDKQIAEFMVQNKEGGHLYVQLESVPAFDDNGEITEIRTTLTDISERLRAERKLQDKSSLLRAIVDFTDVMLVHLDPDFNFLWVNPAYARACKMAPEEMAGRNHFDLFPDKENEEIFRRVRDSGEPVFFKDKPFEIPDQLERGITYWDWSLVPAKDEDGRVVSLVFSQRETTKYKQAELELKKNEEQFRLIADNSGDIIFQLNTEGIITYVSPAIQMLGYTLKEMQGSSFADFVAEKDVIKADEAFREILRDKSIQLLELKVKRADGSMMINEVSATPMKNKDVITGVLGIARDITDRKHAEEKVHRSNLLLQGIKEIFEAGMRCESDKELAVEALRVAERVTASRFGFIGEIGPDGLLHDIAVSDPGWEECAMDNRTGHRSPPGDFRIAGLYGLVLSEGKPFFTNEPSMHQASMGTPEGHPSLLCFLGVPIVHADTTIGIFALANREEGYGDENVESVKALAEAFTEILFRCRMEKALALSEERERNNAKLFKQLVDFTPIPIWVAHDPECRVITSNIAASKLLGVEPDQNISQTAGPDVKKSSIRIFHDGNELDGSDMPLQYAVHQAVTIDNVEVDIITPGKKTVRMIGAATPLYDTMGNVSGGIGAFLDITERKRLEEELLHAKREWEKTFDAVPDLIAILDPQHRIVRANKAMAGALGRSPAECVGKHCFSCFHKTSNPISECPNRLTMQDGKEHTAVIHEEGMGAYYLVTTTPFVNEAGEMLATVHVARNITQLKKAEKLLRASEKQLKSSQKLAHLGSWELDTINNKFTWSDETFRIFGQIPQSFLPTYEDFLEFVHPDDRQKVHDAYFNSLENDGTGYEINHRIIIPPDNEIRYVHEKCRHIRNEKGEIIRSEGMVHDITERVSAEQQVQRLNMELQQSVEELEALNSEYERSNDDLQQYAYILSHDLQEPLRTITGFVQLLSKRYQGKLDDKADSFIEHVVEGTTRMQKLMNDLLEFSRVGGGKLRLEPISLETVVEKTLGNLSRSISESGAIIESDPLPMVTADALQLPHLFQNLIVNALKFSGGRDPHIRISAERKNGEWIIAVRDNGIGIDPRFADRIFLLFQRLHRREEYNGTGLGLAICKKVVERHGGRIWVESDPGSGSTFYFSLPVARQDI